MEEVPKILRVLWTIARVIGWTIGAAIFYMMMAVCLAAIVVNAGMRDETLMLWIVFGGPFALAAITFGLIEWYDYSWYRRFAREQVQMFDYETARRD